jgi:hypothetical protein
MKTVAATVAILAKWRRGVAKKVQIISARMAGTVRPLETRCESSIIVVSRG